jgi:hypothetical protein
LLSIPLLLNFDADSADSGERVLFKHRVQQRLQRAVLASKDFPAVASAYSGVYSLATHLFVKFCLRAERETGLKIVDAIYLRRGAGRGEVVVGASDLDFFVVINTVSAQQEMRFLKRFWKKYARARNVFPFLGETLMGDRNELEDWLQTGCVRAFETSYSWKLLHGRDVLAELPRAADPDPRDVYSEALKCYWALVQPVLKVQDEHLEAGIEPTSKSAILLRHGVKAAIDLFRLHHSAGKSREEALAISCLSRGELIERLPKEIYGDSLSTFRNLLALRAPVFKEAPVARLSELVFTAYRCLDDLASRLDDASPAEAMQRDNKLVYHAQKAVSDPYSLSVRELFGERILFRHQHLMSSCVLSEATAQMYFRLRGIPPAADFQELLLDLRNVSFSLERFNVPMPLSDRAFRQMEKTSLLDSPFHSFYSHREEYLDEGGEIKVREYRSPEPDISRSTLRKTFSELSFALRMQPAPEQFEHFVEKIFTIVLALRLAVENKEIVTSFRTSLESFARRYPTRHDVLHRQISPFLFLESPEEARFWTEVEGRLGELEAAQPARAATLRSSLASHRLAQLMPADSAHRTTDLWINLTPFLRMEMNAVKDRLFPQRPVMKL